MELELINWLKDGHYRISTLRMLMERPALPSELANHLHINRTSMSRILKDLRDKGLVAEVRSNSRTITQKITEKGIKAMGSLGDIQNEQEH